MEILTNNVHHNLLFLLKKNWSWIFFLHKDVLTSSSPVSIECISYLSEPIAITGSNFNSSSRLTIKINSPSYLYFFNEIKPIILLSINEFFKSKIINEIYIICANK